MISPIGKRNLKVIKAKCAGLTPHLLHIQSDSDKDYSLTAHEYSKGAGFTLIELILTAIIVLVIVGLSVPVFKRTFSDLRVNLQVKDMASLMNLAREKAIMTRIPHIIKIDADKRTYRMFTYPQRAETGHVMILREAKVIPIADKWGRRFSISRNIKVEASNEAIKFFPDGSSNGANISFEDISGVKSQIQVDAGTGEITVGRAKGQ